MTDTEEEKQTVTALDYIESQEQLEREAQSILPGKFEKCTFPLGYVRQPLYACKTCLNEDGKPAGMCYSCSIACHASHELFELFPKRAFRCDCGLGNNFSGHSCALTLPAKKIVQTNDKNTYNHNFEGRYCRCDTHYDPVKEEATMYQCIACEDWFHEYCIGNIPEAIDDFECYVCRDCTKKYPFLMNGQDERFSIGLSNGKENISKWILSQGLMTLQNEENQPVSSITSNDIPSTDITEINHADSNETKPGVDENTIATNSSTTIVDEPETGEKRKFPDEQEPCIIANTFKKQKLGESCQNIDVSLLPKHDNIEIFLQEGWREGLCKCANCMDDFKSNHVEYLLAEEKTFEPEEDEDAGKSLLEVGMEQLQRVDRVQALESLMAYKSLADDIKHYLQAFKNTGKTVTKQDIDAFFAAKRQEREEKRQ